MPSVITKTDKINADNIRDTSSYFYTMLVTFNISDFFYFASILTLHFSYGKDGFFNHFVVLLKKR